MNGARASVASLLVLVLGGCGGGGGCQGCGRSNSAASVSVSSVDAGPVAAPREGDAWRHAKEGEPEDLAALAVDQGAAGLVEGASDPELRSTAIRAMAYARGWAQLPFLATVARDAKDDEALPALESIDELASRPRTAEDPEDAEELREGCEQLVKLARDGKGAKRRRIVAIRALRKMPCSKADLPTDLDAR